MKTTLTVIEDKINSLYHKDMRHTDIKNRFHIYKIHIIYDGPSFDDAIQYGLDMKIIKK